MKIVDVVLIIVGLAVLVTVFSHRCEARVLHCSEFGYCTAPSVLDVI